MTEIWHCEILDTGVVEFAGAPIQNLAAPAIVRLGIARTFQGTRLFKRLSVIENLRAAAQLRHRLNLVDAVFGLPRLGRVGLTLPVAVATGPLPLPFQGTGEGQRGAPPKPSPALWSGRGEGPAEKPWQG